MSGKNKIDYDRIHQLCDGNHTIKQIAETTGYNTTYLYQICKNKNWKYKAIPPSERGGSNRIDMIGFKIHQIEVLSLNEDEKKKRNWKNKKTLFWNCRCPCGQIFSASGADIRQGKIKTCGCRTGIKSRRNFQGYKEICKTKWSSIVNNAKQRNLKFDVTIEQCWDLYIKQGRKCVLSGMPIDFKNNVKCTASLDRIDSSQGYELSNLQWVHKDINKLKNNFSDQQFINLCRLVAEHSFKN